MGSKWYGRLDRNSRLVFWTSFAGFSLDAMDVQLYAFVLPVLAARWGLSHAEAGLVSTVTLASSALGGWGAGFLADRFGRVRLLRIMILWLAFSTCLCGLVDGFWPFLAARALQGIGFGGEWAVGAVFVAEIAAPEFRGRMVGTASSGWPVGWGLAAAGSTLLLSWLPPDLGWRATFLVGFPPALALFFFRLRIAESPAFLAARQREAARGIFAPPMRSLTARGSLLAAGLHGSYWAIATWWPAMLATERGFSRPTAGFYFGILVLGSLLGYWAGAWLSDRSGRRRVLAGFALCAAALLLACTEFGISDRLLLALSFPLGFFSLGMYGVIGSVLSELYPTELRGSGLGFCFNFGRGVAGATPLLVGGGVAALGLSHAIGLIGGCAYGLIVLATLLLPETRGRDLTGRAPSATDDRPDADPGARSAAAHARGSDVR